MADKKYIIIGAGPCGLGAAYRLNQLGVSDWVILERNAYVGGLSASFRDDHSFVWDLGGHVMFSHYEKFDRMIKETSSPNDWIEHKRESWIRCFDRFIPYPFQQNIQRLPREVLIDCIADLVETQRTKSNTPKNFHEWVLKSFGQTMSDVFMRPYNEKVWAYPLDLLGTTWLGERVATIDLRQLLANIISGNDDVSWGPNNNFKFPAQGGTGAIWNSLAATLPSEKIILNDQVVDIDPAHKIVTTESGKTYQYDALLSTLPATFLATLCHDEVACESLSKLRYSSTHVIGLGFNGNLPQILQNKCWMYFPESNCPFYRVTVFSHYSPNNVARPGKQWSIMAEISESDMFRPAAASPDEFIDITQKGLLNTGLISPNDKPITSWYKHIPYGYPTPTVERDNIILPFIERFDSESVFSRGRFGAWRYEVANMDHSFMQGHEWADFMINLTPETTFLYPEIVNSADYKFKS